MGQETRFVMIDTDILIKIFRGDEEKRSVVQSLDNRSAVSVVTAMELYVGAKNRKRLYETGKRLKSVSILELTSGISAIAYRLVKKYNIRHQLFPSDALIAATAIEHNYPLYTDNLSDYNFITELQLFTPKQ